jgi:ribosomal protein L11 methyltransferase
MRWVSLSLEVEAAAAEGLADALLDHGALSVELTDADNGRPGEMPLFQEPGEAPSDLWPRSRLSALFDAGVDLVQAVAAACWAVEVPVPAQLQAEPVQEQDWVRTAQRQFGPIEISPRLWIAPSWCEPPDPSALILKLDPGLAFGTGTHPTTWQCLRWLDEHLRLGQSVLDYGCGSGILAIAAKKLGAGRVVATDIDPDALQVSSHNALQNGVALDFLPPDALGSERFDVVVANILANPLRLLAPLLAGHACPAGQVVLAGLLEIHERAIRAAYTEWFDLAQRYACDGWICLSGQRRVA